MFYIYSNVCFTLNINACFILILVHVITLNISACFYIYFNACFIVNINACFVHNLIHMYFTLSTTCIQS